MLFLTIFFRPLRPFLILQVGVSLREVLSVVEVLPTLDVSSCKKYISELVVRQLHFELGNHSVDYHTEPGLIH